jgi:KipI family sensor histidine kinase inhibitor
MRHGATQPADRNERTESPDRTDVPSQPRQAVHAVTTYPRLLALGDSAWTVEFGNAVDPELNARVMALDTQLRAALSLQDPRLNGVCDTVPSYRSLSVHFDPLGTDANALGALLLAWAGTGGATPQPGRHWQLPLCCDEEFAPDLAALAKRHGLDREAVLARLFGSSFRVYMIGFMPGFPYMGGWPAELATPRLAAPRKRVPPHSVAVAGTMCGVYPWPSPGGWNILGRTPAAMFDPHHPDQPAWLAAGDLVCWQAIDRAGYEQVFGALARGERARESFLLPSVPAS